MDIKVENLAVSYDGITPVLESINLTVKEGEFVAIVGLSGSGKSTLLHALAGFIPYSGRVSLPENIGIVFQNYAVFPWLTVWQNIGFGLHEFDSVEKNHRINSLIDRMGLRSQQNKFPQELSGGQRQRVALARAMAPDPEVVFMDEPFGALDMYTRYKMHEWLAEMMEQASQTILLVTHNIEEAIFLADRVIVVGNRGITANIDIHFERPRRNELKFDEGFVALHRDLLNILEKGEVESHAS